MEIALDILSLLYILATNIVLSALISFIILCSKICHNFKQKKRNLVFSSNLVQSQHDQDLSKKSKKSKTPIEFLSKQNTEEAHQQLLAKDSIYNHHHPQELQNLKTNCNILRLDDDDQEQFGLSTSRSISRSEIYLEEDEEDSPQTNQSFSSSSLNQSGNLNESYSLSSIDLSDTDSNQSQQLPQERDMKYKIRKQRNTIKKSGKTSEKLKFLCKAGDRELSYLTSLDSYLYLAYLKFCVYFFLFLSIPSCILLLPIYIQPKEDDDKSYRLFTLDNLTIANIFQNQNRMIIVALFVLTYSFMNYSFIYNYAQRVQNKQYFSLSRQHHGDSQFSNHALMIRGLPKKIKTLNGTNQVFQFFRTKFRGQVISANLIPSYEKLMALNQKLQKLIRKLNCNSQGFDDQALYLTCFCCCKSDDKQQRIIESSFAKKMCTIFCCCCVGHSINHKTSKQLYREQKDQIQAQIQKINQAQVFAQSNCGIAFVTFESEDSMIAALEYIQQFQTSDLAGKGYQQSNLQAQFWDVTQAPAPSDIIWDTLCRQNQKYLKCRRCYLNFFLTILAAVLILPPSIIDRIASISYIEQSQKKVYNSTESTDSQSGGGILLFYSFLQLYFTPILSVIITTIVIPWLIYKIAMYDSHELKSLRARSILRKNFIFIGLSTIILPIVGFAITISCLELKSSFEGIVSSVFAQQLVNQMSRSSDFFLRYIIQLTFYFNIIQIIGVPIYTKKMYKYQRISTFQPNLQGELTQKKKKKNFTSWFFEIGHSKVISMAIYIVVLSLSVITPLVVPIGCFFFAFKYFTDKWNIMFVSLKQPQSDGTIRQFLITYSIISIFLFQFLMAILFILTLNTTLIIVGVSLVIIGSIVAIITGKRWGGAKKKQHYTKKNSIELMDINRNNPKMTARQVYPQLQERLKQAYIHPLEKQRPPPGYQHNNKKKLKLNFNKAPKSSKQQPRQQKKLSHSPRLFMQIHAGESRKAKRDFRL